MFDLEAVLQQAQSDGTVPLGLLRWAHSTGHDLTIAAASTLTAVADSVDLRLHQSLENCADALVVYEAAPVDTLDTGSVDHRPFVWTAYNCRSLILDRLGRPAEAVAGHRQALAFAESVGYERGMAISGSNLGRTLLRGGNPTEGVYQLLHPLPMRAGDNDPYPGRLRRRAMAAFYYACNLLVPRSRLSGRLRGRPQ